MNLNENHENEGKIIKKRKQLISAKNHHQTTIAAWFFVISDAIWRQIV